MTTPLPISPDKARTLLKQAMDSDPGTLAQRRVSARLEHSVLVGPLPPTLAPALPFGPLATSPKLLAMLALLAGTGIGVGLDRLAISTTNRAPAAKVVESSRAFAQTAVSTKMPAVIVEATPSVNVEELPLVPNGSLKRSAVAPVPEKVEVIAPNESHQSSLREQQALLDQARLALGRGQPERSLTELATHRSRFPSSMLAEERDALTIKALAATGDLSVAREQAAAFVARYPRSLLLPSIEKTVGMIR